jgi:hypothetical protein
MQTAAEMEDMVASTLRIASDWKAKGDIGKELMCVAGGLEELLAIAVMHHESLEAGVAYLHGRHAAGLLARYLELNTAVLNQLLAGNDRAIPYCNVTFTHIGWLLGQHALGDAILKIVCNVAVAKASPPTKFWTEYHRAMAALVARQPFVPAPPAKLRGYERHWAPYLDLVAALTSGGDSRRASAACAASFSRRNRDKRLSSGCLWDGSGHVPVRWDVRAWSILGRWSA